MIGDHVPTDALRALGNGLRDLRRRIENLERSVARLPNRRLATRAGTVTLAATTTPENGVKATYTFPTAFAATPVGFSFSIINTNSATKLFAKVHTLTATGFQLRVFDGTAFYDPAVTVSWIAVGTPL